MTTLIKTNSIHRSPWQLGLPRVQPTWIIRGFLLIPHVFACFGLAPMVQAVGPDTDGAIPGSNNGEGTGVLVSRTVGIWNTGTGFEALNHLTGGNQNTATGFRALFSDTSGSFNTATGVYSLFSNTSGFFNSATGAYSLANNTIANYNTANGYGALYYNTEGEQNTAAGFGALYRNTTGSSNTANGVDALFSNTTGEGNTAVGTTALLNNITGSADNAVGFAALRSNTSGDYNNAVGRAALTDNVSGGANNALGDGALAGNVSGSFNIGIGDTTLVFCNGDSNVVVGSAAGNGITTGSNIIAIGEGVNGVSTVGGQVDNSCYIRNIINAPIDGGTAAAVYVDQDGKLGTVAFSSQRFKKEIRPMRQTSQAVLALKPVTFQYKYDQKDAPQFGLIAEEVAEVNAGLVVRDKNGEALAVRYDAVTAMLLNEFLKEHRKVEEQEATIIRLKATVAQQQKDFQSTAARQEKEIKALTASLKEQAAQIQKVSAKLEARNPAPQMVLNNP